MGSLVLFDTNIVIDIAAGVSAARLEYDHRENVAISIVTWMEVMAGVRPSEELNFRRYLASYRTFAITDTIAEQAVVYRRARRLKLPMPSFWLPQKWRAIPFLLETHVTSNRKRTLSKFHISYKCASLTRQVLSGRPRQSR